VAEVPGLDTGETTLGTTEAGTAMVD
jgi:hypothetical protein